MRCDGEQRIQADRRHAERGLQREYIGSHTGIGMRCGIEQCQQRVMRSGRVPSCRLCKRVADHDGAGACLLAAVFVYAVARGGGGRKQTCGQCRGQSINGGLIKPAAGFRLPPLRAEVALRVRRRQGKPYLGARRGRHCRRHDSIDVALVLATGRGGRSHAAGRGFQRGHNVGLGLGPCGRRAGLAVERKDDGLRCRPERALAHRLELAEQAAIPAPPGCARQQRDGLRLWGAVFTRRQRMAGRCASNRL